MFSGSFTIGLLVMLLTFSLNTIASSSILEASHLMHYINIHDLGLLTLSYGSRLQIMHIICSTSYIPRLALCCA